MTLKTLFAIPIAIILLVTLSLAAMITGQGWSGLVAGRTAVEAVERMRLLLVLQTSLRAERVTSNFVLGKPYPLPDPARRRLVAARADTDRDIRAALANVRSDAGESGNNSAPERYMVAVVVRLGSARALIDDLLTRGQGGRTLTALDTVMPRMMAIAEPLDAPLQRASLAVTAADAGLSGLVTEDRLAESLRDQVGLIAGMLLPRFDKGEQPSAADLDRVRILLARAAYLTRLLDGTMELAGSTEPIRRALVALRTIDVTGILRRLDERADDAATVPDNADALLPQRLLVPWGERINQLRTAIMNATVERVTSRQVARERQFDVVMTAFGAVMVAVLESVVLLRYRVFGPLAQLGSAITRIAAGNRGTPLVLHSDAREIAEMGTAVETLRQAALVADATALRHRVAARHRLEMLRQALGIARTVREPAHALERGVASLSEGIDAAIALIATPPATLGVAATAVRAGLANMRDSAAEFDATFEAADSARTEDRPEAEFVAHILAVRAQVDRRSEAVRGFVQHSLVALRDAASATEEARAPALRALVSDQFARVEETVATISGMQAAVTRAAAILRELPLEDDTPLAA